MRIRSISAVALPLSIGFWLAATPVYGQGKAKSDHDKHPAQAADKANEKGNKGKSGDAARRSERAQVPEVASQDRGKGRGKAKPDEKADKDVGRDNRGRGKVVSDAAGSLGESDERGRGRFLRSLTAGEVRPNVRVFVVSKKHSERFAGRAVALAALRGVNDDMLLITPVGSRVHVKNKKGDILLDIDEDRARNLGSWKVVSVNDRKAEGSPSFCRSGAGHPVWGRQWCIDKGFGIGVERDVEWARAMNIGDIVFRRTAGANDLTRDMVASVLGEVVFNRLAAHAITLGYTDPITGRWYGEASGPQVLLLSSGSRPIAELTDSNRDGRADALLVTLRPW